MAFYILPKYTLLLQDQQNMLVENTYVRVYGSFRGDQSDGQPNSLGRITAFSVRPVEDHNEVSPCPLTP